MKSLTFLMVLILGFAAQAAVLAPSALEVKFSYSARFQTAEVEDATFLADVHAQHIFGYLQSPGTVAQYGVNARTLGVGAPRFPLSYQILSDKKSRGVREISYKVTGYMLIHKLMVADLEKSSLWNITLPYDLDGFYDEKCTDPHYPSWGDFWYFHDPLRAGCEHLTQSPMAVPVAVRFSALQNSAKDVSAELNVLRGDNGNGDLFEITTINGFSESATNKDDEGRQGFEEMNQWFRDQGFQETILARYENRPVHRFEKTVRRNGGGVVNIRITRLLAETGVASRNVTFAKFFKDAVKNSDVVIYAGHSGLGGNLDIPSIEAKAGPLEFPKNKSQLFFFDGCSTYSYFYSMFAEQKTKGRVKIMSNALLSYFNYEGVTHRALYRHLFSVNAEPTWGEILSDMERPLRGMTFMLNVGPL